MSKSFTISAIFNTGGRLLVGFVAGFKKVNSLLIHNIALVTGGAACILSMFCVNYWLTCIYAAYFGLCVGKIPFSTSVERRHSKLVSSGENIRGFQVSGFGEVDLPPPPMAEDNSVKRK